MNQVQVISLFNSLDDIPSFYDHAPNGTRCPFLIIHVTQPDNFAADDHVYCENWHFRVDLYTREKSPALEKQVKDLLNTNKIYWERSENYIYDQSVYEIEFEFDTFGNVPDPEPEPSGGDSNGNTSP